MIALMRSAIFIVNCSMFISLSSLGLDNQLDNQNEEINKILNVLQHTKGHATYDGKQFPAGYQTHVLGGITFVGQRDPQKRLAKVPYDFTGKTVLDIGCNQGGMLFALKDKIKWGIGIDYDSRLVNAANRIKSFDQSFNLDFYVFDLDKEPLTMIDNFLKTKKVDICFFLSLCTWVKKWKQVIDHIYLISDVLLFESNGIDKLQAEEFEYLDKKYKKIDLISDNSDDDNIDKYKKIRKLYICRKN